MRHKTKFHIILYHCPRCGKAVATGNISLFGADVLKAKFHGICEKCITPEERHEIEIQLLNYASTAATQRSLP